MQTVAYKTVLGMISQLCFGDPEPADGEASTINAFFNLRTSEFWRSYAWPELCPTERRWFRESYDSTKTYAAPTEDAAVEVFFAETGKYYQALRSSLAQAPAISGAVNAAYWAESLSDYSGDDWAPGLVIPQGRTVRRGSNGRFYACHTTHTAASTFDETKFGILTEFVQSISRTQTGRNEIGDLLELYERNPKVEPGCRTFPKRAHPEGWVIFDPSVTSVWVHYRKPVPTWSGPVYDPAQAYASGVTVFSGTDYYIASASAGVGVAPPAAPWKIIEFPLCLRSAVVMGAYADWLKSDGQHEKARTFEREAIAKRDQDVAIIQRQQGAHSTLNVRTL